MDHNSKQRGHASFQITNLLFFLDRYSFMHLCRKFTVVAIYTQRTSLATKLFSISALGFKRCCCRLHVLYYSGNAPSALSGPAPLNPAGRLAVKLWRRGGGFARAKLKISLRQFMSRGAWWRTSKNVCECILYSCPSFSRLSVISDPQG